MILGFPILNKGLCRGILAFLTTHNLRVHSIERNHVPLKSADVLIMVPRVPPTKLPGTPLGWR